MLPQIKDEAFDEAEKRFRLQERLIKSFIRDISLYLQHIRVRIHFQLKLVPMGIIGEKSGAFYMSITFSTKVYLSLLHICPSICTFNPLFCFSIHFLYFILYLPTIFMLLNWFFVLFP